MSDIKGLVSDFLSGKSAAGGPNSLESDGVVRAEESTSSALDDYGTDTKSSESTESDLLPGNEDTSNGSEKEANAKASGNSQTPNKEVITITDENGKRKVEIDYSNRESIKKAFQLQHGARKWQAERDKALESKKSVESELGQVKSDWAKLDEAFQRGPEHLFDLLQGPGAFDKLVQKRQERAEFMKHARPEQIQALEAQERAETQAKELDKIRKENEDFKRQVMSEKDKAEEAALESRVHPVFDKYRFAEKLGNTQDEHLFDSMLWNTALQRLEPYEEKGIPITQELVDKEFRTVANALRSRINSQAEKKATKVVEQKKREATENVQAKVVSGYKTGGSAQEARDLLKKGDLTSVLKGWGTYGKFFNK